MKRIEAIIRPSELEYIVGALEDRLGHGFHGLTVFEVRGFGRQGGRNELYRGAEYGKTFVPKVMMVLYVGDDEVEVIVEQIVTAAREFGTGKIGAGKIVVSEITHAFRIRTGENGENAI